MRREFDSLRRLQIDRKDYNKRWYEKNKESEIQKSIARKNLKRAEWYEFKKTLKCLLCSENEPICLDFHHKDPNEKEFKPSQVFDMAPAKRDAELAKCVVLCSNCHRKVHAGLLNIGP